MFPQNFRTRKVGKILVFSGEFIAHYKGCEIMPFNLKHTFCWQSLQKYRKFNYALKAVKQHTFITLKTLKLVTLR